ncbi:hypothetical protein N9J72_02285 [Candidatus Gracilibacteria bacterium]|nr:hypothetical protein [Candidatus Gracilibacteria bacterium]
MKTNAFGIALTGAMLLSGCAGMKGEIDFGKVETQSSGEISQISKDVSEHIRAMTSGIMKFRENLVTSRIESSKNFVMNKLESEGVELTDLEAAILFESISIGVQGIGDGLIDEYGYIPTVKFMDMTYDFVKFKLDECMELYV